MARTTNNKKALTIMIIILIILGLSAGGIGYYLYTIQDVTPKESNASNFETDNLCLEIVALQKKSNIVNVNEEEKSSSKTDSTVIYDIFEEGSKQTEDLSHLKETTFITIFDKLPEADSQTQYTDATYTINGNEEITPIISYDSLDEVERSLLLEYYQNKGFDLAELSQKSFAINSIAESSTTINIVTKGKINHLGTILTSSCGAIFTSAAKEIQLDEPSKIKDENQCLVDQEYWCDSTSSCIPIGTPCRKPIEILCPEGELLCDDNKTCVSDISLCEDTTLPDDSFVGGEQDEHGCLSAAGYSWCESLNQCIREWETDCPSDIVTNGDTSTTSDITVTIAGSTTCVERMSPSNAISFTISIRNSDTDSESITKIVNKLPLGFTYTTSSTLINGSAVNDDILTITETGSTQELTWDPTTDWTLLAGQTMTLRLTAIAEGEALTGGNQNETVVTPLNTPVNASALRATYVITVAQTCTNPKTGIFDTMIGRIMASIMLIVTAIIFYKSNSSQKVSEKYVNNKAINNINTSFRLFGLKLTHPRKFFEEKFESKQKK